MSKALPPVVKFKASDLDKWRRDRWIISAGLNLFCSSLRWPPYAGTFRCTHGLVPKSVPIFFSKRSLCRTEHTSWSVNESSCAPLLCSITDRISIDYPRIGHNSTFAIWDPSRKSLILPRLAAVAWIDSAYPRHTSDFVRNERSRWPFLVQC